MYQEPKRYSNEELVNIANTLKANYAADQAAETERLNSFYHDNFSKAMGQVQDVLATTDNLIRLLEEGQDLLTSGLLPIIRNMDRPTVSEDSFKVLSEVDTVRASRFKESATAEKALRFLEGNLNKDLFPWLDSDRKPTEAERHAASVAVAALLAEQRTKTHMRTSVSKNQESVVRDVLASRCGMKVVNGRAFDILVDGPKPGELFQRETGVAGTKADVVLGLFDGRIMCLECKVSNSAVNSYKRLNHEVMDKVAKWKQKFGEQCVSGGVLQGCFTADNLISAQDEGACLFWSSSLDSLVDFVNSTKRQS